MSEPKVTGSNTINEPNAEQDDRVNHVQKPAYPSRLWPPPCLQAYCLDHFAMECEIYHEQENDRYDDLVIQIRELFLADREHKKKSKPKKPIRAPTRHQPPRQAKEKNNSRLSSSLSSSLSSLSSSTAKSKPQRPRKPTTNDPFTPPRLEKEFRASQAGTMLRILSSFHEKLELHKSWEDYWPPLEEKIREAENRQRLGRNKPKSESKSKSTSTPTSQTTCAFGLGSQGVLECRYCNFAARTSQSEHVPITPRKLAAPTSMNISHRLHTSNPNPNPNPSPNPNPNPTTDPITKSNDKPNENENDNTKEWGVMYRGTNFFVDICGPRTMIVLVDFRGILDLCEELFGESRSELMIRPPDTDTPTGFSVTACFGGLEGRVDADDGGDDDDGGKGKVAEVRRWLDELISGS